MNFHSNRLKAEGYKYPPPHHPFALLSRNTWLLDEELRVLDLELYKRGKVAQIGGFGASVLVKEVEGNRSGDLLQEHRHPFGVLYIM